MRDCVFCKILAGKLPASRVYEDDLCMAFLDIQPVNAGHVLIIPKEHREFVHELDDATAARLFVVANRVNRAFRASGLKCEGVNYFLADGAAAFQEVAHSHLHCFPRFANDGFGLKFSGKYFEKPSRAELDEAAETVRKAME